MNLRLQFDTTNIHWERVAEILQTVGMALFTNAEKMKQRGFTE